MSFQKSGGKNKQAGGGNRVKLYSDFYHSDIILASPLGLNLCCFAADDDGSGSDDDGTARKKPNDIDFLSSVEILLIHHADLILMQNWDHVNTITSRGLNRQPTSNHSTIDTPSTDLPSPTLPADPSARCSSGYQLPPSPPPPPIASATSGPPSSRRSSGRRTDPPPGRSPNRSTTASKSTRSSTSPPTSISSPYATTSRRSGRPSSPSPSTRGSARYPAAGPGSPRGGNRSCCTPAGRTFSGGTGSG